MKIYFGALVEPIEKQLANQGLCCADVEHFEQDAQAITRLKVRGLLTHAEGKKSRLRLLAAVSHACKEVE